MSGDERRQDVLRLIVGHTRDRGYPPTVRWLAGHLGVSVSTIHSDLQELQGAGRISLVAGRARAIRVEEER